jgi:hypothetical protein
MSSKKNKNFQTGNRKVRRRKQRRKFLRFIDRILSHTIKN